MIYHVLAGDSLLQEFQEARIEGETIVCRECLIAGPVDSEMTDGFWTDRGRFVLAEYGEDEIAYQERVADQLTRLTEMSADDEVNLWFEYELFCSTNLWFCLSLLKNTGAKLYRVEPITLAEPDRWSGFANSDAKDLRECFEGRAEISSEDLRLGVALWDAYRTDDRPSLSKLAAAESACFPYLSEVCSAAIDREAKACQILSEIRREGAAGFAEIFAEFVKRAGVYGYGDTQVQNFLAQLDSSESSSV